MKKTLITAAALLACAGTQLFAQNAKQDTMTFNLTRQYQTSVSTSSTANAGTWDAPPTQYKTKTAKLATADILRAIAIVLYANPNQYSAQAKLVLVQGELGGFFGLREPIANNVLYTNSVFTSGDTSLIGEFYPGAYTSTFGQLEARLATGRHFDTPAADDPTGLSTDTRLAPGHDQPWGQVFVQDVNATVCDNVTFFFNFDVVECYDCFYLSSFISDSKFTFTQRQGPPCCAGSSANTGSGTDRYYMYLSFDNTIQNPYLDPSSTSYVGWASTTTVVNKYAGIQGLYEIDDGVTPDALAYDASIFNNVANPLDQHPYDVYEMRFTIGGIVTYSWSIKLLNPTDSVPDFVGSAAYPASGYGYVAKTCSLMTGTASFAEKVVKATTCCLDRPWYDSWYGVGYDPLSGITASEINIVTALTDHPAPASGVSAR